MATPGLERAAASTRTEAQVRALRAVKRPGVVFLPRTIFTLWQRWPDEVRLFSVEHPQIETMDEAIEALAQFERTEIIIRHDDDCPPRDVSEDIAMELYRRHSRGDEVCGYAFQFMQDNLPASINIQAAE